MGGWICRYLFPSGTLGTVPMQRLTLAQRLKIPSVTSFVLHYLYLTESEFPERQQEIYKDAQLGTK